MHISNNIKEITALLRSVCGSEVIRTAHVR